MLLLQLLLVALLLLWDTCGPSLPEERFFYGHIRLRFTLSPASTGVAAGSNHPPPWLKWLTFETMLLSRLMDHKMMRTC
jgi:hypothetical protein